jgi:hypothetical protein
MATMMIIKNEAAAPEPFKSDTCFMAIPIRFVQQQMKQSVSRRILSEHEGDKITRNA